MFSKADGTSYVDGQVDLTELTGRAYGNMYADNATITCTIAATDTYVQVPNGITGGTVSGFTFQNSRELKCNVAGVYLVNWSMSVNSGSANQEIEGSIMINGTASTITESHCEVLNPTRPMVIAATGIVTLAVNDLVSMGVSEHTAIHDIIVNHLTLTLLRIG